VTSDDCCATASDSSPSQSIFFMFRRSERRNAEALTRRLPRTSCKTNLQGFLERFSQSAGASRLPAARRCAVNAVRSHLFRPPIEIERCVRHAMATPPYRATAPRRIRAGICVSSNEFNVFCLTNSGCARDLPSPANSSRDMRETATLAQCPGNPARRSSGGPWVKREHGLTVCSPCTAHSTTTQGQISFRGGRSSTGTRIAAETALRERRREIGPGRRAGGGARGASKYVTVTGYRVTRLVGLVPAVERGWTNSRWPQVLKLTWSSCRSPANYRATASLGGPQRVVTISGASWRTTSGGPRGCQNLHSS